MLYTLPEKKSKTKKCKKAILYNQPLKCVQYYSQKINAEIENKCNKANQPLNK